MAPCADQTAATRSRKRISGGLVRFQLALHPGDLVAQRQAALFQAAHHQLIGGAFLHGAIDQGIEISMLDTQLNQMPFGRVEIRNQNKWV